MKQKPFKTESALCQAFVRSLPKTWTAYAETAGYDLLVARDDGFQIGVQAKLRLNPAVFSQSLDYSEYQACNQGPDCRAVLVPWNEVNLGLERFAPYVGVTIVRMTATEEEKVRWGRAAFDPVLPDEDNKWSQEPWFDLCPTKRCELPEYVPDVAGGERAPRQLTQWKIGALKIAVLLERDGYVVRRDFRNVGIDHRRWIAPGTEWLRAEDGKFVPAKRLPDFKSQHPVVYEQIKADLPKWAPGETPNQGSLL